VSRLFARLSPVLRAYCLFVGPWCLCTLCMYISALLSVLDCSSCLISLVMELMSGALYMLYYVPDLLDFHINTVLYPIMFSVSYYAPCGYLHLFRLLTCVDYVFYFSCTILIVGDPFTVYCAPYSFCLSGFTRFFSCSEIHCCILLIARVCISCGS